MASLPTVNPGPNCPRLPSFKKQCNITLPFGGPTLAGVDLTDQVINFTSEQAVNDTVNRTKNIANAFAPMLGLFKVIDAVLSIKNALDAIPSAITSLDPGDLITALSDVTDKVAQVSNLIPQVSIPAFLKDILACVISLLIACINTLEQIQEKIQASQDALNSLTEQDPPSLVGILECSLAQNVDSARNAIEGIRQLSPMLTMLGLINALIGGGQVPDFANISENNLDDAKDEIQSLINKLATIRNLLP